MGKIYEDGLAILTYDDIFSDIYWVKLSQYLQGKYAVDDFANPEQTEIILKDAFQFLVSHFEKIILQETDFSFFSYVFTLHENTIKLYFKTLKGYKFRSIEESEFALYRRILKLILEQGCDLNLNWGTFSSTEAIRIETILQHLIYIATWIYDLSDRIANCKMVENCYKLEIEDGIFTISYNNHFAQIFNVIPTILENQYEAAICDMKAATDLDNKIFDCFGFRFSNFSSLVQRIQSHHNPTHPNTQIPKQFNLMFFLLI